LPPKRSIARGGPMTPRRRVPKPASPSRASSKNGPDPTAVILEQMQSQFKVVIELVQGCATKTEVAALKEDVMWLKGDVMWLKGEVGTLTMAVKNCATKREMAAFRAEVNERFAEVNQRFDVLTAEVARKAEGATLGALERRVTALEQRAG